MKHGLCLVACGCALVALALSACKRKPDVTLIFDAAVGASDSPANANDITRYPTEKKLDSVPAVVLRDAADVRKSPPNGPVVSTLPKGTTVTEIAQGESSFVVTFTDPASGRRLMGWMNEDAFSPGPAVSATAAAAPRPTASARRDGGIPSAQQAFDDVVRDAGGAIVVADAGARGARGAPSSSASRSPGAKK
jgi:hypothetical protein